MKPFRTISLAIRKTIYIVLNFRTVLFLWRHRKLDVAELFRRSWQVLPKRRAGLITGADVFNITPLELMHYEFRQIFKIFFPQFRPMIRVSDPELWSTVTARPCLIATAHAYNELAICRLLDERGLPTAFVSHSPNTPSEVSNYGLSEAPLNIPVTPKLFLDLRSAIRGGHFVVCDVDFVVAKKGKSGGHFVSPSIFQFHQLTRIPLYFACNRVESDGTITCFVEKPENSEKTRPKALAELFIAFVDRIQNRFSNCKVGDWAELTKDNPYRYSIGKWTRKRVQS